MKLLWELARSHPWRSLGMLLCLLLGTGVEGLGISSLLPFLGIAAQGANPQAPRSAPEGFEKTVLDGLSQLGIEPTFGMLLNIIVAAMMVKGLLALLAKRQVGYTVAQVTTDMRLRLLRALLATNWAYFTREPIGSFSNAFASEAPRASQAFLSGTTMLTQIMGAVVYTGIALATSWPITLVAILLCVLTLAGLSQLLRLTQRAGQRQTSLLNEVLGRLTDVFQGVKSLKVMAQEPLVGPLLEKETHLLNKTLRRQIISKEAVSTIQDTALVIYLAVGVYVAVTYLQMELSAIFILALIFIRVLTSTNKAYRQYQEMLGNESAYWSMTRLIERAEQVPPETTGTREPHFDVAIELKNVTFRYGEMPVLEQTSCMIPSGRITVIVGPSGAGKTTLVGLLVGLLSPESGEILIDRIPIEELDIRKWRQMIGYVPQEIFLFHDSIAANVSLGDPKITRDEIVQALHEAEAWEFVSRLPEGMDTFVGERGSRLSGGQRQRIAIARALVRRPTFLILDEGTASLDPASKAALWAKFAKRRGTMTILAITHHMAFLPVADYVYGIHDGRLETVDLTKEVQAGPNSSGSGS